MFDIKDTPPLTNNVWVANSNRGGAREDLLKTSNIDWRLHPCVSSLTGVLWFRLKSLHPAACQSTRWARPLPVEHPPLEAHPTFLLLRQQPPRAWSTLQVRDQAETNPGHLYLFFNAFFFPIPSDCCVFKQIDSSSVVQVVVWATSSNSADA